MKVALTNEQIAGFLECYATLCRNMRQYSDMRLIDIYTGIMNQKPEGFEIMIRVYEIILEMRKFSYFEDLSIDFLREDDLDLDGIKNEIFCDKKDAKRFTKKQIIKYIRNGMNHSDGVNTTFQLSKNGRFIEIINNMAKPIPFHVRLTYEQLVAISNETINKGHNLIMYKYDYDAYDYDKLHSRENLDKIKYVRYYFKNDLDYSTREKLLNISVSVNDSSKTVFDIFDEILSFSPNLVFERKEYPLMDCQKNKVIKMLKKIPKKKYNKEEIAIIKHIVDTFVNNSTPLPSNHIDQIYYEEFFLALFLSDANFTYNQISNFINTVLQNDEVLFTHNGEFDEVSKDLNKVVECFSRFAKRDRVKFYCMNMDNQVRFLYPIVLTLDYIAINFLKDENITIKKKTYETKHIRNAFVHGKWFISDNYTIELFDSPTINGRDCDYYWHESINVFDLHEAFTRIVIGVKPEDPVKLKRTKG